MAKDDAKVEQAKVLSRDDVLSLNDTQHEVFFVPEWNGSVPLTGLDAWSQSRYEQSLMKARTDADGKVQVESTMEGADLRLAASGIREPGGKPWFTEEELREKSGAAIKRIANRVRTLSGMDRQTRDEIEGN